MIKIHTLCKCGGGGVTHSAFDAAHSTLCVQTQKQKHSSCIVYNRLVYFNMTEPSAYPVYNYIMVYTYICDPKGPYIYEYISLQDMFNISHVHMCAYTLLGGIGRSSTSIQRVCLKIVRVQNFTKAARISVLTFVPNILEMLNMTNKISYTMQIY